MVGRFPPTNRRGIIFFLYKQLIDQKDLDRFSLKHEKNCFLVFRLLMMQNITDKWDLTIKRNEEKLGNIE